MMAQPSDAPVSVIGPQFISPDPLEVIVDIYSSGNLVVTDINHRILLKVKPCDTEFHQQRFLLDANDRPIVLLREKNMSEHNRWNAFRGESKTNSDMIFSAKSRHMFRSKTDVNVFLANKKSSKDDCDFKIKGSWSKRNCTIYMGDSSTTIAEMHTVQPLENVKFAKDKIMVTIYPNVDFAFVVTLIAIVDAMNSSDTKEIVAGEVAGGVAGTVGEVIGSVVSS